MWVQFLQGPSPKICVGKNRPKFSAIFDNLWLWSRISPERINISKIGKAHENLPLLPRWTKEFVYFGPQTKKLLTLIIYILMDFFRETTFWPLGGQGCCPLKFLHALQIDQGLLVHTRKGMGPPKIYSWKLKIWLNFSVLESITSGMG